MKRPTYIDGSLRKRRPPSVRLALGAAALAAIIMVVVATAARMSTKPTTSHPPQTGGRPAATCAPDDSRPVGPGGEGVPACLVSLP